MKLALLTGETISAEYKLEYGTDKIEMHVGAIKSGQRVLLIDDLIATGGTMAAGMFLIKKVRFCKEDGRLKQANCCRTSYPDSSRSGSYSQGVQSRSFET